ncbi:MAG TPA: hypothetical protein VKX17_03170 [Planctomycetota bacterium]|nr:hypothetical protein [Planctomycetota bacterium]
MIPGLIFLALGIGCFIGFGALGAKFGKNLERRGVGSGLEIAFMVLFGVGGAVLVLWIVSLVFAKP